MLLTSSLVCGNVSGTNRQETGAPCPAQTQDAGPGSTTPMRAAQLLQNSAYEFQRKKHRQQRPDHPCGWEGHEKMGNVTPPSSAGVPQGMQASAMFSVAHPSFAGNVESLCGRYPRVHAGLITSLLETASNDVATASQLIEQVNGTRASPTAYRRKRYQRTWGDSAMRFPADTSSDDEEEHFHCPEVLPAMIPDDKTSRKPSLLHSVTQRRMSSEAKLQHPHLCGSSSGISSSCSSVSSLTNRHGTVETASSSLSFDSSASLTTPVVSSSESTSRLVPPGNPCTTAPPTHMPLQDSLSALSSSSAPSPQVSAASHAVVARTSDTAHCFKECPSLRSNPPTTESLLSTISAPPLLAQTSSTPEALHSIQAAENLFSSKKASNVLTSHLAGPVSSSMSSSTSLLLASSTTDSPMIAPLSGPHENTVVASSVSTALRPSAVLKSQGQSDDPDAALRTNLRLLSRVVLTQYEKLTKLQALNAQLSQDVKQFKSDLVRAHQENRQLKDVNQTLQVYLTAVAQRRTPGGDSFRPSSFDGGGFGPGGTGGNSMGFGTGFPFHRSPDVF